MKNSGHKKGKYIQRQFVAAQHPVGYIAGDNFLAVHHKEIQQGHIKKQGNKTIVSINVFLSDNRPYTIASNKHKGTAQYKPVALPIVQGYRRQQTFDNAVAAAVEPKHNQLGQGNRQQNPMRFDKVFHSVVKNYEVFSYKLQD